MFVLSVLENIDEAALEHSPGPQSDVVTVTVTISVVNTGIIIPPEVVV